MSDADARFDFLLSRAIPFVLAPIGSGGGPRLRGVVRGGAGRARIVLCDSADMRPGVAVEYDLGSQLDVPSALDHARFVVAPVLDRVAADHSNQPRDSHGDIVIAAADLGFDTTIVTDPGDQRLFGLFSLLTGGGIPWFADDFAFAGFLHRDADTCRIYIKVTRSARTYGIDLDVTAGPGRQTGYAYLTQELAPLARTGDLDDRPVLDDTDDYCDAVIDITAWLGPARR
ncbi:hypothetical protein ACFYTQ_34630 [Nocardia sp. NPDC004068]|uniref:hypothetical protein n=1 Tax=Nocardia sp. NPDC004068 TaxID=3364303 RepID=UPI0036B3542B